MSHTTAPAAINLDRPRFRSVILDVDSTVCDIEGIDWLAARRDPETARESEALTAQAMAGEIPIEAVYTRRLHRIRPTDDELLALAHAYRAALQPGATELIAALQRAGVQGKGLVQAHQAAFFHRLADRPIVGRQGRR